MKILWPILLLFCPIHAAEPGVNHAKLYRVTFYTKHEDKWSAKGETSTGHKLENGICAVDPKYIAYGSRVIVPGIGIYEAWDTGTEVKTRRAAKESAHTFDEFKALVIDIYTDHPEKYKKQPEYIYCWIEKP